MNPEAGLLVQHVAHELVVHDIERHKAHRLNEAAARVWEHCDGVTSVGELAALTGSGEALVWEAVHHLERANLMEEPVAAPAGVSFKHIGIAAGIAMLFPVVESVLTPDPASAKLIKGIALSH